MAAEVSSAIGTVLGLVKRAALEPHLTGPLLYILTRGPERFRQPLKDFLLRPFATDDYAKNLVRLGYLVKTLKWLFALGLAARVNNLLTLWALNHWKIRKQGVNWDFDESRKTEIAIVTGGASGFGLLTARGLATKMRVVVLDVSDMPEDLKRFPSVSYYKCDITSASNVSEVASTIRQEVGTPTILINNAGVATAHTILDTSEEFLEKVFRVNLLSHWTTIKEFLPAMLEAKKGHIVGIASMASYFSVASLTDYAATKAGVLALHEGLNQELKHRYGPNGRCIQTSVVHPMWARTPLIKDWESSLVASKTSILPPESVADKIVRQVLSGRSGQVFVPSHMSYISGIRGFPAWLQETLRDGLEKPTAPR